MLTSFAGSFFAQPTAPDAELTLNSNVLARLSAALTSALALDRCAIALPQQIPMEGQPEAGAFELRLPLASGDQCLADIVLSRASAPFDERDRLIARSIVALAGQGLATGRSDPPRHLRDEAHLIPEISTLVRDETGLASAVVLNGADAGVETRLVARPEELPAAHPGRALFAPGISHLQVLPIVAGEHALGAVYLACPDGGAPGVTELAALASRIAVLLGEFETGSEADRHTALQRLLADATEVLLDACDLTHTMNDLCQRAAGVLGDGVSITLIGKTGTGYDLVAAAHVDPAAGELIRQAASLFPDGVGMSAEARRREQPVVIDPVEPSAMAPARWSLLQQAGLRRAISVPLRGANGSSGNLAVYATRESTILDQTTLRVATILGDRIGDVLTRHELLAAAEQQAASLEALLRSAEVVAQQGDPDATLTAIALELERIIPNDVVAIWRIDRDDGMLRAHVHRVGGRSTPLAGVTVPLGIGLISSVVETRQPAYYPEAHRDPRSFYSADGRSMIEEHGGESMLVAPLIAANDVIGILSVSRLGTALFTPDEFKLFQLFAGQAAVALHGATSLDLERHRRLQAEQLAGLAAGIARAGTPGEILPIVAREAAALAGCDRAWIGLRDPERETVSAMAAFPPEAFALPDVEDASAVAGLWPQQRPCEPRVVEDLTGIPEALVGRIDRLGLENAVFAPLLVGDVCHGALLVWRAGQPRTFVPDDVAVLDTLARQTAAVVAKLRVDQTLAEQLRVNTVLRRAAEISLTSLGETDIVNEFAMLLGDALGARIASVWLLDPDGARLTLRTAVGDTVSGDPLSAGAEVNLADGGPAARACETGAPRIIPAVRAADLEPAVRRQCTARDVGALVLLPIASLEGVLGVARLDYDAAADLPDAAGMALAVAVTRQLGIGLATSRLRERWRALYRSSVEALAATVDARDPFTHTHSRNVAHYSRVIAERLGLSREQVEQIELAGLLHDIGKIGIADRILTKTGPLDPDERMVMMTHPTRGSQILASHEDLAALVPIVRHHHERYDGFGYPDGLAGNEIHVGAAIVCVADAFDTMVSDRSYARRRPAAEALRELRQGAGTQFRPDVVGALAAAVDEDPRIVRPPVQDATTLVGAGRQSGLLPAREVAQVRVLSRIARELGALTDLHTFVDHARRIVATELGYPDVEILLRDPRTGALVAGGRERAAPVDEPRLGVSLRLAQAAIAAGTIINVGDLSLYPDAPAVIGDVRAVLVAPLVADNEPLGALCVTETRLGAFFAVDEELLSAAADQLAAAVRVAQLHDQAKRAARHDGLTDALNHRAFYQELDQAIVAHEQHHERVSLVLCDVEGLKQVNDHMGHLAGDQLLKALVSRIRAIIRPGDVIARYGGDEFAVLTYGTTREQAETIGKRLRASLSEIPLLQEARSVLVTVGVAQIGEDGDTPAALVASADARLYEARGRRVTREL